MDNPGNEELVDYDETQISGPTVATKASLGASKDVKKGSYVGVHSTGFRDFLLKPELLRAILDCGFEHPSEVQQECIPQSILGMDVLCQAKSGMGKTAVFVLTTLQQLEPVEKTCSVLVICHTRELAFQINNEYHRFTKYMPAVKTGVYYGGVPLQKNIDDLKTNGPNIVVGTPGRILALVRDKHLDLKELKHFVLDECDKLLEQLDMRKDIQDIFRKTPLSKQVMMFTATLSQEIREVCKRFMQNPLEIYVDNEARLTLHGLQQYYVKLQEGDKNRKLSELLDTLEFNQVVIFVRSVSRAEALNKLLNENNFPSVCIHSRMEQKQRIECYKDFKDFKKRIMVATDILGRGIDIERVNIVINYDMPDGADSYLHRVGRAGRFGTKGLGVSFVSTEEDTTILNQVQDRFEVSIEALPSKIDSSTYSECLCVINCSSDFLSTWLNKLDAWFRNVFQIGCMGIVEMLTKMLLGCDALSERFDGQKLVQINRPDLRLETLDIWAQTSSFVVARLNDAEFDHVQARYPNQTTVLNHNIQDLLDDERPIQFCASDHDWINHYHRYKDTKQWYQRLAQLHPGMVMFEPSIGVSAQGRDIFAIKVGNQTLKRKPAIFLQSLQHAREWISGAVVHHMIYQLMSLYPTNHEIRNLLNQVEFIIVPIVNPDGYEYTWTTNRFWRKNRPKSGFGVDLNRNWDDHWGIAGSSNDPESETFMGTGPASEPETRALQTYFLAHSNIVLALDLHSYSELIMWPYGHAIEERPIERCLGILATWFCQAISRHGPNTLYRPLAIRDLYLASGTSVDYFMGDEVCWQFGHRPVAFAVELGPAADDPRGFVLPPEEISKTGRVFLAAMIEFVNLLVPYL